MFVHAGTAGDSSTEAGLPPVTEVRGTARTTRSDPGRRSTTSHGERAKRYSASFSSSKAAHESHESSTRDSGPAARADAPSSGGAAKRKKSLHRGSKPSSRAALDLPGHVMVVEVVDTGTGVSESARARLFGQFVQGSDKEMEQPRSVSGTGLGLSICARQVPLPPLSCRTSADPHHAVMLLIVTRSFGRVLGSHLGAGTLLCLRRQRSCRDLRTGLLCPR